MRRFFALLFMISLTITTMAQINYKHYVLMGRISLSKEHYTDAIRDLNIAIEAKPQDFEAYFLRGIAKFSLDDYSGAVADFTKTLEIHPLYVRAYHYRGLAHDRLSDYADAERDYSAALKLDPFNLDLHLAIGATKMHLNAFDEAISAFDTALLINPNYANAYINRGIAKRFLERYDDALDDMNKAVENDYFNVEALVRRGILQIERKQYADAMFDFNAALRLTPNDPLIYFNRALAYLNLGDTTAALSDYERVNKLDERNALTYFNRAIVYSQLGNYEYAEALYNKVIELNPSNIYGYFNRGILYYKMKDWDAAEDDFTRVIELFPDFIDAWLNRAAVRYEKKDIRGAEMDQYKARSIMELVNKQNGNLDSLYNVYSSQVGTNKIIQFEADFVSGDRSGSLRQFSDVEVHPFENIIVNVIDIEKYKKGTIRKAYFVDASLSRINQEMRLNGNLVFIVDHIREEGYNSLITGDEEIEDRDVQLLYEGISQLEICNYQKAESAFNTLILNDKLKRYAIINLVAVQCAKAELVLSDNDFSSSVYINDKRVDRKKYDNQIKPDYAIPEKTLNDYLMTAPKDGFAWYNLGNVHLKEKNFEKALNDYTLAVKYEPTLAEAYYNKGLVLLFIGRGAEARPMLSKAGELGIDEAYAVMKRYL